MKNIIYWMPDILSQGLGFLFVQDYSPLESQD